MAAARFEFSASRQSRPSAAKFRATGQKGLSNRKFLYFKPYCSISAVMLAIPYVYYFLIAMAAGT
jgi:hypothetical protein